MPDFNEKLLQFIWQHRLLKPGPLFTAAGNEVVVLKPGDLNTDAGPDFFNGQILLNGLRMAGNIELHLKTSDWLKHGHQQDKNYDTIILHVVYEHDTTLQQNLNNNVEVLELKTHIPEKTISVYNQLISSGSKLPCATQLKNVNELKLIAWMERMTVERLEEKVSRIVELAGSFDGNYTQTFYTLLLRNFGFKVNALPFEMLARQLPVQLLLKHSDNLLQLEALLLGMAGFLEEQVVDKQLQQLQNEFEFLRHKYQLIPLQKEIFKFSRLRPANFPDLRLGQFALLLHKKRELLTNPQSFISVAEIKNIFKLQPQGYWKNHYTIGGKTLEKDLALGETSAENIVINTLAPFLFFYSKKFAKPRLSDLAIELLANTAFEKNAKTRLFDARKDSLRSAADSQAVINLYDHYCVKKKCLNCGIGTSVLAKS
ncbi:MAG: DUF2851 family protein [Bacteroidota bacterium]